jgi:hypothetical protein
MSRFDYRNAEVISRKEVVSINPKEDFLDILINNNLNRVQKVLAIREAVRASYGESYREVILRFVDGVIVDLIESNKLDGRPLPETMLFEVELRMPIVEASDTPVYLKKETFRKLEEKYGQQEPTYFNDEWNQDDPTGDYHDAI